MIDHPLRYSVHTRLRETHLARLIAPARKDRFLDVGCGLGYMTERFGREFETAVGLEYDFASLALNAGRGLPNMVQGSAYELPFAGESFDVILCSELLEHLPDGDDAKAVRDMARILKPGGRLLITVPSLHGMRAHTKLRNLGHDDPSGGEYHHRVGYDRKMMRALFADLPEMRIAGISHSMFLIAELFMDLLKWVYFRKNRLKEHSDIMAAKNTPLFKAYRAVFPVLGAIFDLEDALFCGWADGHIMIVEAEKLP